jgi:hypothetical protein
MASMIDRAGHRTLMVAWLVLALSAVSTPGHAQTFQGRVRGQGTQEPVETALVKLLDEDGDELAITIADSAGFYRLEAEDPGVFRLVAERIGYRPFESPLLQALDPEGVYPIDLDMAPAPVELRGFTVMTDRLPEEEADRTVRWEFGPAILVYETPDGPCFAHRSRGCLPVYLNGLPLNRDFMPEVPLDMVFRIQVLASTDGSIVYPSGAVLLYTEAWLR